MLPEDAILLPEIVDAIFLVASYPASQGQHEEVQSVGHGRRLHGSDTAVTHVVSGIHSPRPFSCTIRVVTIEQSGAAQAIELRDPNNDLIVVRGLDTDDWANPLQLDDSIYLFGLECTENRRSHGLVSRPRNFHERPPDGGRRLRRAEASIVFIGREDRGNMTGAEVSP